MNGMITVRARMYRTDLKYYTPRAKRLVKREANRSERRAPIPYDEYEEPVMAVKVGEEPHPDDVRCRCCGSVNPSHRMTWVKQPTWGPCDCCEHWDWVGYCSKCVIPPMK